MRSRTATCRIILTFISLLVFALMAVASEEKRASPLEQVEALKKKVEEIRGLKYKSEFKKGLQSSQAFREFLKKEIDKEYPDKKLYAWKRWLVKFGFINDAVDIKSLLLDLLQEQVVGYYDPERKSLYLIDKDLTSILDSGSKFSKEEEAGMKFLKTMGFDLYSIFLIHELDHALEDQYFDLTKLRKERERSEDASNAIAALIEGQSTLLMIEYAIKNMGLDISVLPHFGDLLDELSATAAPGMAKLNNAPEYFREGLLFPYLQGAKLSYAIYKGGGWDLLNKAFKNPPSSTEQVLHPEKYLRERDNPIVISLSDIKSVLGDEWELLEENSLGELNISILARKFLPTKTDSAETAPDLISAGWGGDAFQIFEHRKTKESLLVWYTTWDSIHDAQKFFKGYNSILEKKYTGLLPETGSAKPQGKSKTWRIPDRDKQIFVELRGSDMIIIEGVSSQIKDRIVEKIWLSKKKELASPRLASTK